MERRDFLKTAAAGMAATTTSIAQTPAITSSASGSRPQSPDMIYRQLGTTGEGSDGAAFNPDTMEAFSTQGEGTLTIIKSGVTNRSEATATDFYVEQNLKTQPRARTLTLDLKTGHIITATADFGPAPAAQPGQRVRPPMIPNTCRILVIGK